MKVVIVGGGFAGVKAALELKNVSGIEVVLISKGAEFEYHGVLGVHLSEVVVDLQKLFESAKNITVVKDKVVALNARVKAVKGETGQIYRYDKLLLCIGRNKDVHHIPGASNHTYGVNKMHDVRVLYHVLSEILRSGHHSSVRVIVVGAGLSGVEIAGGMRAYASMVAQRYSVKKKRIEVELIESQPRVLPGLQEKASYKAAKRLEKLGVELRLGSEVVSCSQNAVQFPSGEERVADIIVWAAGSRPMDFFAKYPEVFEIRNGHVVVDEHMRVPKAEDIFVLGDSAEALYRGMAQTSVHDAVHVAQALRIMHEHPGAALPAYKLTQPIYVVPIGENWALVQKNGKVRAGKYGWLHRHSARRHLIKHFEPLKTYN